MNSCPRPTTFGAPTMTDPAATTGAARKSFLPAYAILGMHLVWLLASSMRLDVLVTVIALSVVALSPTRGGAVVAIVLLLFMAVGNILSLAAVGFGHEKSMLIAGHLLIRAIAVATLVWGIVRQPS